jgi:FemAB-related protein (PEP-CTERM system-associated)
MKQNLSIAPQNTQCGRVAREDPWLQVVRIRQYNNVPGAEWDDVVRHSAAAHLAGASAWYATIQRAYGHLPLYLYAEDGPESPMVLPAFLVRRPLLGVVVTSMPFLDAGGPCGGSGRLADTLIDHLIAEAQRQGANQVELRCTSPINLPLEASLQKVSLVLPLPSDADRLWRGLDPKVRNQIRKAERSGLTVEVGGIELLDEFYRVFAINMRDLGSPVHAKKFFHAILESFGESARVVLVKKNAVALGGLISLVFKDTMYVPWASSLREYASLCPNMLLYWDTLRRACNGGLSCFDFGRSTRGSGTYRFKRQWRAEELQLFWYTLPLGGHQTRTISPDDGKGLLARRLWSRLPVGISRVLGPRIRRYLTQ